MMQEETRKPPLMGLRFATATLMGAIMVSPSSGAAQPSGPARIMKSAELLDLYGGKTWMWDKGAGYLHRNGRFTAYVPGRSAADSSYADGRWWVNDNGVMCFEAQWYAGKSARADGKCLQHRILGEAIFQRLLPDGDWYTFRTAAVPLPKDEYAKFRSADLVTSRVRFIKALTERQSRASSSDLEQNSKGRPLP